MSDHADAGSELSRRLLTREAAPRSAIRILADLHVGDEAQDIALSVSPEALKRRLETITETLECYQGERAVLPPSMVVHLAHGARSAVVGSAGAAVGLFGALEIQFLPGPLDRKRVVSGKRVDLGGRRLTPKQSPTQYL